MIIRYKLSSRYRRTGFGKFLLPRAGVWFEAGNMSAPPKPCTNTVLHHYSHPALAVIFNPIHASFRDMRLFEIEIDKELGADGLKGWCRRQRIIRELPVPDLSREQLVAFAIYCAEPYSRADWQKWAQNWMDGTDRSRRTASNVYQRISASTSIRPYPGREVVEAAVRAGVWDTGCILDAARAAAKRVRISGKEHPNFVEIIDRVLNAGVS